jgi:hypothetical protein
LGSTLSANTETNKRRRKNPAYKDSTSDDQDLGGPRGMGEVIREIPSSQPTNQGDLHSGDPKELTGPTATHGVTHSTNDTDSAQGLIDPANGASHIRFGSEDLAISLETKGVVYENGQKLDDLSKSDDDDDDDDKPPEPIDNTSQLRALKSWSQRATIAQKK